MTRKQPLHTESNNTEAKPPREAPISGHKNWGKGLLHAGECEENPGRVKDGERDSLILSTKPTQILGLLWSCMVLR